MTVSVLAELNEATPDLRVLMARMAAKFPGIQTGGVWNRRKIAGTNTWSQHAWGNAIDLYDSAGGHNKAYLDEVAAWLERQPETRLVLWQVKSHFDHIHYETNPKKSGTPPFNINTDTDTPGGNTVTIEQLQEMLNERGHQPPLNVDGAYGPLTKEAWVKSSGIGLKGDPGKKGDKGDPGSPPDTVTVLLKGTIRP